MICQLCTRAQLDALKTARPYPVNAINVVGDIAPQVVELAFKSTGVYRSDLSQMFLVVSAAFLESATEAQARGNLPALSTKLRSVASGSAWNRSQTHFKRSPLQRLQKAVGQTKHEIKGHIREVLTPTKTKSANPISHPQHQSSKLHLECQGEHKSI